ncbi:hypothetical protein N431DRAFT_555477 [Stipitochalara longipes BDJ]|nr:hypothetical protein N431DRAFT_555477 [Stipitochalara longipes BDJ]
MPHARIIINCGLDATLVPIIGLDAKPETFHKLIVNFTALLGELIFEAESLVRYKESFSSDLFGSPKNILCELPSGDNGNNTMTPLSHPIELVSDVSILNNDRWLGNKILEVAIANWTLRSLPQTASERNVQDLYQEAISNFRFEECFKALCNENEVYQADANFQDALLSQIGHIHRQSQTDSSVALGIELEQYISDPRRHQNEKFVIKQESNGERTPEARTPSEPRSSPLSRSDTNTRPPSENDEEMPQGQQLRIRVNTESEDMPEYTAQLQEYAAKKNLLPPSYDCIRTQFQPMRFTCKVSLGESEARGQERSKKKEAKHSASKALWEILQAAEGTTGP